MTAQELLDLILSAKRLEDLQNDVRDRMIRELMEAPDAVDKPVTCRPPLWDGHFPEVDGVCP